MNIALIGYGEVGRILAEDLRRAGQEVTAHDIAPPRSAAGATMRAHVRAHGVTWATTHADAVKGCELVVSVVTADQTVAAAQVCADSLRAGTFFLDLNSASPSAKVRAAEQVIERGGRYVEGAVMAPVPPHRIRVPLLLGGPDAAALEPVLGRLGFVATVTSGVVGVASATKMCRSVIVKGLEALVIEGFTAARHYGVEAALVASLEQSFPAFGWEKQAAYFFQRAIEHGRRRSEEMREAAVTVRDAGIGSSSASAAAARMAWLADLSDEGTFGHRGDAGFARSPDWRTEADRILAGRRPGEKD